VNYREELAERLDRVPFSARKVALRAGVSPGYVSDVKNRKAHSLTLETAGLINAALDELANEAKPEPPASPAAQSHPGVEALAADVTMRARCNISDEDITDLRSMILPAPVQSKELALVIAAALKSQPQQ